MTDSADTVAAMRCWAAMLVRIGDGGRMFGDRRGPVPTDQADAAAQPAVEIHVDVGVRAAAHHSAEAPVRRSPR